MMTTVQKDAESGKVVSYTKGAVDRMIVHCSSVMEPDGSASVRPMTDADIKAIVVTTKKSQNSAKTTS